MKLMDVTIRESVYYGSGIDYEEGLEYLSKLPQFIYPDEVEYIEICYVNNLESGHLNYHADYIRNAAEVVNGKYKLVGMMHPGCVDLDKWDPSAIRLLSMVRIVCGGEDIPDEVGSYVKYLHALGVDVGINISFALRKSYDKILDLCKKCVAFGADYVYLADSSGSGYSCDIKKMCDILLETREKNKTGLHLHDHLSLSFANAIEAIKNGIDITDVSITGAGRGGGNLKTEFMIPYLKQLSGIALDKTLFHRLLEYIEYFNVLIKRDDFLQKQQFLDTLSGIFKLGLRQQEIIEKRANGNGYKYIEYVFEDLKND